MDSGSEKKLISDMLTAAHERGAEAIAVEIPEPELPCSGVDAYVPSSIIKLLKNTNCWLDAGTKPWIYSKPFEIAFESNPNLRYMVVGGIDNDGMTMLFGGLDIKALKAQTDRLKAIIEKGSKMKFKCPSGTAFEAQLEHRHVLAADIGDASLPGFHTPPALINIVPAFGKVTGQFRPKALMLNDKWTVLDAPMTLHIKDGVIAKVEGEKDHVESLEKWLEKGDEASRKFAHLSIGLSPNIKTIQGNIMYDERIDGVLDCGFGHVSPIDAPPHGQASITHFDAITEKVSVWVDETQIMDQGKIIL